MWPSTPYITLDQDFMLPTVRMCSSPFTHSALQPLGVFLPPLPHPSRSNPQAPLQLPPVLHHSSLPKLHIFAKLSPRCPPPANTHALNLLRERAPHAAKCSRHGHGFASKACHSPYASPLFSSGPQRVVSSCIPSLRPESRDYSIPRINDTLANETLYTSWALLLAQFLYIVA